MSNSSWARVFLGAGLGLATGLATGLAAGFSIGGSTGQNGQGKGGGRKRLHLISSQTGPGLLAVRGVVGGVLTPSIHCLAAMQK